jgi:hypothetical protein
MQPYDKVHQVLSGTHYAPSRIYMAQQTPQYFRCTPQNMPQKGGYVQLHQPSQLKLLRNHQAISNKMRAQTYNSPPVFMTRSHNKAHQAERKIRTILQHHHQDQELLAKRDAVIDVQTDFFSALRKLYTWPLDSVTFANSADAGKSWDKNLTTARQCAYRAENIDPHYSGHMRYDIMCEIVQLETKRIQEFIATFDHYQDLLYDTEITDTDESYCDDLMLSYLDENQSDVIKCIPPTWIEEARRPPLTWYGFLCPTPELAKPFMEGPPLDQRLLDSTYYE